MGVVCFKRVIIGHPQVGGDDLRVVADLGRPALGDLPAELQHDDPVADAHDQPHVVLDEQHGDAGVADLADQVEQRRLLGRVEPGRRLVQAQQRRLGGQRPGDLQPALVAVGQVAGQLLAAVPDADEVQQLRGALVADFSSRRCRGKRNSAPGTCLVVARRRRP